MALTALIEDYLFVGPLVQARLIDLVPDIPVMLIERSDELLAADKRAKVLMVMWAGENFPSEAGDGSRQITSQRWGVSLGVNNASPTPNARNKSVGATLSQVHLALAGWVPAGAVKPFKRATAALRPLFTPTRAIYTLGFDISLAL